MKPHRTDGVSLSFGLIFLVVVAWWLVAQVVDVRLPTLGWFAASVLILLGGFGLLGALRAGRAGPTGSTPAPADPAIEPVSGVPAEVHADIVRELLDGTGGVPMDPATARPGSPARPPQN